MALDVRTSPSFTSAAPGDHVFRRTRFFLRRQRLPLEESYSIQDEDEMKLLFVERPMHHARRLLSIAAALLAGLAGTPLVFWIGARATHALGIPASGAHLALVALLLGAAAAYVAGVGLSPKRHVSFFRDQSKRERLIQVEQDARFQVLSATYTVKDAAGDVLARVTRHRVPKRWVCHDPRGALLCAIRERASILRRLVRLAGLSRTDFVFVDGTTVIGRCRRESTRFDSFVLDVAEDERGLLDRRVALAIGVLLDTGER